MDPTEEISDDNGDAGAPAGAPTDVGKENVDVNVVVGIEKKKKFRVVSPKASKTKKTPSSTDKDVDVDVASLKKQVKALTRQVKLESNKLGRSKRQVESLLNNISKREEAETKFKLQLSSKDTQISNRDDVITNLRNKLRRTTKSQAAIKDAVELDHVSKEMKLKSNLEASKEQLSCYRKELKSLQKAYEAYEKDLDRKVKQLLAAESANKTLASNMEAVKSALRVCKSDNRGLQTQVNALQRQNMKLLDDQSDKKLEAEKLQLEMKKLEVEIAKGNQQKKVLEEHAKEQRQLIVARENAKLKEASFNKRKADKKKEAIAKRKANNKRLKASMVVCDGSLHHTMNRNNPSNGQFLNYRALQERKEAGMLVNVYDSNLSALSGGERRQQPSLTQRSISRELPEGVTALRDSTTGRLYYQSIDTGMRGMESTNLEFPVL